MEIIKTVLEFVVYVLAGYAIGDIIISVILYKKNPSLAWEVRRTFLSLFKKKAKVVETVEEDDGFADYYGESEDVGECICCGKPAEDYSLYCSECAVEQDHDCEDCEVCKVGTAIAESIPVVDSNVDVTQPAPMASCDNAKDCVLCPFTEPCDIRRCNCDCKKDETNG